MTNQTDNRYDKAVHLGFIQAIIARLANNSFLVRGWLVAVLIGSFAVSDKIGESIKCVPLLYFGLIIIFWISDTYFLYQERLFRKLYELVNENYLGCYTLDIKRVTSNSSGAKTLNVFLPVAFSASLLLFYAPLIALIMYLVL